MRQKSFIAIAALVVLLLLGAVGVSAYDSSNEDQIAEGVTVAGVDLGGMTAGEARTAIGQQVAGPLEKPVVVTEGKRRFTLSAKDAGLHADTDSMVEEALAASREGSIFSRVWRDLTGGKENADIAPRVTYSKAAANQLVARVAESVDRPAKDARLEFPSLAQVDSQDGLKVNAEKLRTTVATAMTDPDRRVVAAPVQTTKAKVTRGQLAKKYPTLLVLERASFKLSCTRTSSSRRRTRWPSASRASRPRPACTRSRTRPSTPRGRCPTARGRATWPARSFPGARPRTR